MALQMHPEGPQYRLAAGLDREAIGTTDSQKHEQLIAKLAVVRGTTAAQAMGLRRNPKPPLRDFRPDPACIPRQGRNGSSG